MNVTTALPVRKGCKQCASARQPKSIWKRGREGIQMTDVMQRYVFENSIAEPAVSAGYAIVINGEVFITLAGEK